MAKPISLGSRDFPSRKSLQEYLSTARSETEINRAVPPEVEGVLRDLLEFHPDRDRKVGAGVQGFTVRFMPPNTSSFWIERVDGSRIDFSFHKCMKYISGVGAREREVIGNLRHSIRDVINAFRMSLPEFTSCALTGKSLRRDSAAIDHAYPDTFRRIVHRFIASERLTWDSFPIGYSGDPHIGRIITDQGVAARWHQFHRDNAHLRAVDPEVNSKIADKDPATHDAVLSPFIEWVEDNQEFCDRAEQREFMLPRIREVLRAHPEDIKRIEAGHKWLTSHPEDAAIYLPEWISWILPAERRAA